MVKPDLQTEHASETPTTQNKLPLICTVLSRLIPTYDTTKPKNSAALFFGFNQTLFYFSIFLKESLISLMILFDITPAKLVPDRRRAGSYLFS